MSRTKVLFIFLVMLPVLLLSVTLDEKKAKAEKLVEDGVEFLMKNGLEASVMEFEKEISKFKSGEFYIFGLDLEGIVIFHGQKPALKGKNMLKVTDAKGVHFAAKFVVTAQTGTQEGWVDYQWVDKNDEVSDKTSYIKRVPGTDYLIGCGFYK